MTDSPPPDRQTNITILSIAASMAKNIEEKHPNRSTLADILQIQNKSWDYSTVGKYVLR